MLDDDDDRLTPEQMAIRREIRRYGRELAKEAGIDEDPWSWAVGVIRCVLWWQRRATSGGNAAWLTLVTASVGGLVAWLVTFYKLSGGGE